MDDPPKRILVVDDERCDRELVQHALEGLGHLVTTATNGLEAIAILENEDFDRVYTDVMMPYGNGYEVLDWIRAHPTKAKTWVGLMTALANDCTEEEREKLGVERLINKPIDVADIVG